MNINSFYPEFWTAPDDTRYAVHVINKDGSPISETISRGELERLLNAVHESKYNSLSNTKWVAFLYNKTIHDTN